MGIIFYASSDCEASQNTIRNCGIVGIHTDGESINCQFTSNDVSDCEEGIDLEKSSQNVVNGNNLSNNNVSLVLNGCGASNVLRANNMSGYKNNLIVWGSSLSAFLQDIDASNIVDGKTVYYLSGLLNREINTQSVPNAGYLALVNCTDVTVNGIQLLSNKDGFLLAESNSCTLNGLTINGNTNTQFGTGLTFYQSNNNTITNSEVRNNSRGVCFYLSNGNLLFRNTFVGNTQQVASDFSSPFSTIASTLSANKWDNGVEGNYWGDYEIRYPNATQIDATGTENTPYALDLNNADAHPLVTNPR